MALQSLLQVFTKLAVPSAPGRSLHYIDLIGNRDGYRGHVSSASRETDRAESISGQLGGEEFLHSKGARVPGSETRQNIYETDV